MERKKVIAATVIAIAVLLPFGKWVIASRQEVADQKASQDVEQKFVAARTAANGNVPAVRPGGMAMGGGQGGPNGGGQNGGRRWGGGGGNDAQRQQRQQQRIEAMAKEVGLSPAQMKQVQAVQQSSRPMMMDVFRNPNLSREQKQAAMQTLRQAQQEQMNKIMTPEQQSKYTAYREKMRAQRQSRQGQNGGGPGGGGEGNNPGNAGNSAGGQNG